MLKKALNPQRESAGISPPAPGLSRDALCLWMRHMEEYGQVWHEDIGRDLFTQEYWYLLVVAMVHYWRRTPFNIGDACNSMRTGSAKTRENRLRRLLESNWFEKSKHSDDRRQTYVTPTTHMQQTVGAHLRTSLQRAAGFSQHPTLLDGGARRLSQVLETPGSDLDDAFLLPWAEFLVDYTNDWNATFNNRFHTEEYWYPFVHCLRADWAGRPLTMGEACQAMRTGSNRTRENRIAVAITRNLLEKKKSRSDMRTTLVLPTALLEERLVGHFSRTLLQLLELLQSMIGKIDSGSLEPAV